MIQLTDTPPAARRPAWRHVSVSAVVAGLVAVAISYAGPLLVVLEAAQRAGLDPAQTASWVWAISVGSGVICVAMSLVTRQPVVVAWSVPGAALLITTLGGYDYSDAIGAFIVTGALTVILGITGWFGRLMRALPRPIMAGVLAGVLLPFVLDTAGASAEAPIVAGGLVLAYFLGRRFLPRYAVLVALAVGVVLAFATGTTSAANLSAGVTMPLWTTPSFDLQAIMGISIPLLIVTMAGQNGPGLAMMHSNGYAANDRLLLGTAGVGSVLFAPFGAHSINLAAITAGICCGREAHEDPTRRYVAGISCGVFFVLFGFAGQNIVELLGAVPEQLVTAAAGVALIGALQGALADTVRVDPAPAVGATPGGVKAPANGGRARLAGLEAGVVTLAVTASGLTVADIAAPFWGFLAGALVYLILTLTARRKGA
ncbi:benzoate/H(+) symporter BenE family transporter [Microbacterium sp. A93]|uniref:benzoate/H(+) symporter BenE family transporter n=1 Tax=Microbacterium sp. A93 TaxID=3450716 RepID=UPI003F43440E